MADTYAQLETTINTAWDNKASINNTTQGEYRDAVEQALALLDSGKVRVANPTDSGWGVNQWLKKAGLSVGAKQNSARLDFAPYLIRLYATPLMLPPMPF